MSITLMAYPTAFLISPDKAKNETLKKLEHDKTDNSEAIKNLEQIRVLTNLNPSDIKRLMVFMNDYRETGIYTYRFENGLRVKWHIIGNNCQALLSGTTNAKDLQKYSEEYFQKLDKICGENVRLINNSEIFYYEYKTSYSSTQDIKKALINQNADNIFSNKSDEITATIDGNNIKYFKYPQDTTFNLEVEQKINILNIGINNSSDKNSIRTSPLQSLKFQTNIKPKELKDILEQAGIMYFPANSNTPLKTLNATLNWILEDGYYVAEFSGPNVGAIKHEAEDIFKRMNIIAKRDLRSINEQTKVTYTYNTNYTDKGILINTLTEHGASNITENGDTVSCSLFGMDMIYSRNENNSYSLEITQVSNADECMNVINDLNDEYGLNIQEMTYNKIKERLEQENMKLEDETVLADNSIVLTIDVG